MTEKRQAQGTDPRFFMSLLSIFGPLRVPAFRRLWVGIFFSNVAQQMQAVVAAWTMFQLTRAPDRVGLVQTVTALPIMLLALPAGSLSDVYDKRKVALLALIIALAGAVILAVSAASGAIGANVILLGCLLTGMGSALLMPAWQSSMREILGLHNLAAAVALNATSVNLARSLGASLGGLIVLTLGMAASFGANAVLYLPLLVALLLWRRTAQTDLLPKESLHKASLAGIRFAMLSSLARKILFRAFLSAVGTSAIYALLPFIATRMQGGDASTYGFLLGAFGLGAVASGLLAGAVRHRLSPEANVRLYSTLQGASLLVLLFSHNVWFGSLAMVVSGACWVTNTAVYNVSMQSRSPHWVSGRTIALFYAAVAAGLGAGGWLWGHVALAFSIDWALAGASALLLVTPVIGLLLPITAYPSRPAPPDEARPQPIEAPRADEGKQQVLIEARYRVSPSEADRFLALMRTLGRIRERNGGVGFRMYRELADASEWIEHCSYGSWNEYLRARTRLTHEERAVLNEIIALQDEDIGTQVRRRIRVI